MTARSWPEARRMGTTMAREIRAPEQVTDELDEMVDAADSADDSCEKLADLAERIRNLADKEDNQ